MTVLNFDKTCKVCCSKKTHRTRNNTLSKFNNQPNHKKTPPQRTRARKRKQWTGRKVLKFAPKRGFDNFNFCNSYMFFSCFISLKIVSTHTSWGHYVASSFFFSVDFGKTLWHFELCVIKVEIKSDGQWQTKKDLHLKFSLFIADRSQNAIVGSVLLFFWNCFFFSRLKFVKCKIFDCTFKMVNCRYITNLNPANFQRVH